MKYEFHVGDYVETKDGRVGYIVNAAYTTMKNGCLHIDMDVFHDISIAYYGYDIIGEFHGKQSSIPDFFNRIGQYDFTKPKQPKEIERLNNCNWNSTTAKINELVDAVNELRKERT